MSCAIFFISSKTKFIRKDESTLVVILIKPSLNEVDGGCYVFQYTLFLEEIKLRMFIMDVVYLYLFHRQYNMNVDGGGGGSAGGDYAARCDAPFIQAMFPLDPVLGNNPRDPAVMVHNVARYHFTGMECF